MFAQISERRMHWIRWVITTGWLLLILSLFYDPWTAALTEPDHPWSPLRLTGDCVPVQGVCVEQSPQPIGATVFWGAVVPSGIFILLVFSHELWRRICPLSFLSQIPRALGWQRQFKREGPNSKVRYELAKVRSESWLGRNYQYFQFAYLFVGLCGRILFFNADRLVLGSWLLFTIAAAIAVGYFYGGKSWCQYFCPMAPVQTVFSEPRGLLGSKAHMSESRITQSMCRTVEADGTEKSACVACQSPCFDIDSERTYLDGLPRRQESVMRYGYLGLMVGYFLYYYLYAGNWDYYFSGVWNRDPNQLAALMSPGLYLGGQAIALPKLVAVPLVLGTFTLAGIGLGYGIARWAKRYPWRPGTFINAEVVQHRIFILWAFIAFNFFFFFAGRPLLLLLPGWVQFGFDGLVLFLSTLWLQQNWQCSPDRYARENLASRFRKQLAKLNLNTTQALDGRSLESLSPDEVYVLAKVLPDFTREKRHQAYKGVVREALEEGYVNSANSLDVLKQMRQKLGVPDDEHQEILAELGIEDPELLNPDRQRSLENLVRLNGYQRSLERLLRLQQNQPDRPIAAAPDGDRQSRQALRQQYLITPQEEEAILAEISATTADGHRAEALLAQLTEWCTYDRALAHPTLQSHQPVVALLQGTVHQKQSFIGHLLLEKSVTLAPPEATAIAQALAPHLTPALAVELRSAAASISVSPTIARALQSSPEVMPTPLSTDDTLGCLENLLTHYNPLVTASALYLIAQVNRDRARAAAQRLNQTTPPPLVEATAQAILTATEPPALAACPDLEKVVYLHNSDFFHRLQPHTLLALAALAKVTTYASGDVVTDVGDTCRELLILIEGEASIHSQGATGPQVEGFQAGQILDELEVLTHTALTNAIVVDRDGTRILAIPVDALDSLLDQDPDFARRVIDLESQRLQDLTKSMG